MVLVDSEEKLFNFFGVWQSGKSERKEFLVQQTVELIVKFVKKSEKLTVSIQCESLNRNMQHKKLLDEYY